MARQGVLPRQMLRPLIASGYITGVTERYLNPASIDLPLSEEVFRLERASLPSLRQPIRELLSELGAKSFDLKQTLEVNVPYLIRIDGTWRLPSNVYGYMNPKSSTGRVFVLARAVADGVDRYDALVPAGWEGEIWVLVTPKQFPVLVTPGIALTQLRLFDGQAFLNPRELDKATKEFGLIFAEDRQRIAEPRRHAEEFLLTIQVGERMGYECRGANRVVNLYATDQDPGGLFEPISARTGAFDLRVGTSYILTTHERIMVPPRLSAELRPIDPRFGDLRVHAAGYIDPGWGWGRDGSVCGRPITLEVTPYEDFRLRHGQAIVRIRYEHMKEEPDIPYDAGDSNYSGQEGPTLAKFFKR